jgi:uncharacterized RDD family membrane protein YckC
MRISGSDLLKRRIIAALLDASIIGAIPRRLALIVGAMIALLVFGLYRLPGPHIEYLVAFRDVLMAFFLDGLFVIVGPSILFFVAMGGGGMFGGPILVLLACLSIITHWLYHATQESSETQATFGMKKYGLKLQSKSNTKVSFVQASLRHFSKIISTAALFLGFAQILWSPRSRALHDALSGTFVADSATPELEDEEQSGLGRSEWGVTLFGVCILALGIGLPILYDTPYRTMQSAHEAAIQKNYDGAELLYLDALQQAEHFDRKTEQVVFGRDGDAVAATLESLANFYVLRKKFTEAAKLHERLTPMYEKYEKIQPEKLAYELEAFANCYYMSGKFKKAAPLYQRAIDLTREKEPNGSIGFNQDLQRLAFAKMEAGQYKDAQDFFKRAMAGWSLWDHDEQVQQFKAENVRGCAELKRRRNGGG